MSQNASRIFQYNTNTVCNEFRTDYDIVPAVIFSMCFVFGIVYTFFGYRFFKATMFVTGFIFGCVLTYLICWEEQLLPNEGKLGVAFAAGMLVGFITMLVQYVGLFMIGLNVGILSAIASLVILNQFYMPSTKWIPFGTLFGSGLVFGLGTLYFQKSLTILGTSLFGAALMTTAIDYYVELFLMVYYIWNCVKAEPLRPVCWYSWIILGLWLVFFLIGVLTQACITGRNFNHKEDRIQITPKKPPTAPKTVPKTSEDQDQAKPIVHPCTVNKNAKKEKETKNTKPTPPHSRYTHLYQVRRSNGDVISRSYIQSIQSKLTPTMQKIANVNARTLHPSRNPHSHLPYSA